MLSVRQLTKRYGKITALDGVSFDVEAGEVVGFLGPNGAGKSTTMRIVTGYIPATSGRAAIDGLDVGVHSLEARRRIGYLPEHTPLYGDMRVREFLNYRCRIKGLSGKDVAKRVDYVVERCWLKDRERQLIETLSKGYRQRVGIADAMVGDPRLLILDEPTIGLDPNQVREVRKLLKELSQSHTLLLSTHILSEVELVCSRVIMIAQGRKVAEDTVPALLEQHGVRGLRLGLDSTLDDQKVLAALGAVAGIESVAVQDGDLESRRYRLETDGEPRSRIPGVLEALAREGWQPHELAPARTTLEEVFVKLTGGPAATAATPGSAA